MSGTDFPFIGKSGSEDRGVIRKFAFESPSKSFFERQDPLK